MRGEGRRYRDRGMCKRVMEQELFELFDIRVTLVLWQGKIKTLKSRINDSWRKVFDKGSKIMGVKNEENTVWK